MSYGSSEVILEVVAHAAVTQLTLRSRQLLLAPAAFRKTVHVLGVSVQIRSRRYMR